MLLAFRVVAVSVYGLASALWLRASAQACPPGLRRLLLSLPLLLINLMIPFAFAREEICTRTIVVLIFVWMQSFKIAGLAWDRGPLRERLSFAQFALLFLYGFTPQHFVKGRQRQPPHEFGESTPVQQVLLQCLAKLGAFIAITWLIVLCDQQSLTADALYVLALYCWVGAMGEGPAALLGKQLGMPLAPFFDEPYRSSSLADFWGRRWNISAANSLRFLIYEPIAEGSLLRKPGAAAKPARLQQVAGVLATFIGSGVMHEICLWYISGQVTGHWMLFFSMQGPLLVAGSAVKRSQSMRKILSRMPEPLSILLTLTALLIMGHYLFIPPAFVTGVAPKYSASIATLFQGLVPDYMADLPASR